MTGDAAFCPSPLTGMGASLSIVGAYILAFELASNPNHREAFAAYEERLRPFVTKIQQLPPGVPRLAHPRSAIGISLFNAAIRLISSRFVMWVGNLFSGGKKLEDDWILLPDYRSFVQQ